MGASASFTQEELETIIDDLPLALESETLRDALPDLVSKIDVSAERTFRRLIEIARQDEERTPLLLRSLREVRWSGTPAEDEFAWLIGQMTKGVTVGARMDAFSRALTLDLHAAQVAILDALAAIHPDWQIRAAFNRYRTHGANAAQTTAALMEAQARRAESGEPEHEATPLASAMEEPVETWVAPPSEPEPPPPPEEPISFDEEKPPDRLTVRTLLRSIDPAANLAAPDDAAPVAAPPETPGEAFADAEKPPERVTARTLLRSIDRESIATIDGGEAEAGPAAEAQASAAPAAAEADPAAPADPITVRTLLRSLDTVKVKLAEGEPEPAQTDAAPASANHEVVFRSLDTVRLSMQQLSAMPAAEQVAPRPAAEKKPWSDLDLKSLAPAERGRRLTTVRRGVRTPDHRRQYLTWLFSQENEPSVAATVRKEILEFAFERPTLLAFDHATRARLGRWIRDRAAAESIPVAAVLAALRRAIWIEGEKPVVDDESRPIVDAASGALLRAPSEERSKLLGRDFSIWLFAVREFEDFEVLDTWAKDATPGVAEGLFRALAAMAALAARVGGTGGSSALELALGIWDRAHSDNRLEMAKAIAAGWSRGFVLDRDTFFKAFWKRAQENDSQREAVLIALATFDKEIEAQVAGEKGNGTAAAARGGSSPSDAAERRAAIESLGNGTGAPAAKAAPPPEPPAAPPISTPSAELPVVVGVTEAPAPESRKITPPPPIVARQKAPQPAPAAPAARQPDKTDPRQQSPFAAPEEDEAEKEITDRYFRAKREALERAMRQAQTSPEVTPPPMKAAGSPPATVPSKPVEDNTEPGMRAATSDRNEDDEVTEAPDEGEGVIPDEADAIAPPRSQDRTEPDHEPAAVAPPRPTPPPPITPAAKPKAATPDQDVVLPGEPLRTLAEYTTFLKALSAGSAIDELLERHGMDYRQYAACMTAWGKLLQNRPDLALRMGQLLRT